MKNLSSRPIEYSKARRGQARGFTLVELLVVVAIAAILSALLLGGFFQITASNRRSGCQVNMSQIYNALRLYANDYDGKYPYANQTVANGGVADLPVDTMGLWKLYTTERDPAEPPVSNFTGFPSAVMNDSTPADLTNNPRKPVGLYLRNADNLHCPNDVNNENLFTDATRTAFNPAYLSYQTVDDGKAFFPTSTTMMPTYQTQRTLSPTDAADANDTTTPTNPTTLKWKRQLMFFSGSPAALLTEKGAPSATVILWCKWHRTGLGSRNNDIVLFADGSVRSRPLAPQTPTASEPYPGYIREP